LVVNGAYHASPMIQHFFWLNIIVISERFIIDLFHQCLTIVQSAPNQRWMFLKFSVCLILAIMSTSSCFRLVTNRAHSSLRSQLRGQKLMAKAKGAPANPVAIVTGAGRGIGKAIALALGDAGCKVIINYIANESLALDVCNEIKARAGHLGAVGIPVKANCADPAEIKAMFAKVNAEVSDSHQLVCCTLITFCSDWSCGHLGEQCRYYS
jgi:hypothetical protein